MKYCEECKDQGLDINFCNTADSNVVEANQFDGYAQGEDLSQWGCDKVEYPKTPIIRFGDSSGVYVVENIYE